MSSSDDARDKAAEEFGKKCFEIYNEDPIFPEKCFKAGWDAAAYSESENLTRVALQLKESNEAVKAYDEIYDAHVKVRNERDRLRALLEKSEDTFFALTKLNGGRIPRIVSYIALDILTEFQNFRKTE